MKTKSEGFKPLITGACDTRAELVRLVRHLKKSGKYSQEQIAERADISQSLVSNIITRRK